MLLLRLAKLSTMPTANLRNGSVRNSCLTVRSKRQRSRSSQSVRCHRRLSQTNVLHNRDGTRGLVDAIEHICQDMLEQVCSERHLLLHASHPSRAEPNKQELDNATSHIPQRLKSRQHSHQIQQQELWKQRREEVQDVHD